ncbi:MAG: Gfo/Idh/MocA family oxidoreductase [Candidatus Omnitrophica bacterium]|nr:Gfo/Idh/MocA family oxidoreductase [Candidatus Omnitrophota bacterium]
MQKSVRYPRRKFLWKTGIGLGGVAIAASPNLFLNRTRAATGQSPSEVVRLGLIGAGGRGRNHLFAPWITKNFVAVCDVDANHLASAQKDFRSANGRDIEGHTDYRRLLDNKDIDAVVIAVPDHWHALTTVKACQAGKDVFIEKPLTLSIEEGWHMIKAARHYQRIVQTGSQQRSSSEFLRACEYVRSGRIGNVKMIRVGIPGVNWTNAPAVPDGNPPSELDYDLWLGPAPWRPYNRDRVHYYFRFFWDYSGGQMTNWGAHHLDIAQRALDMDRSGPTEITARADYDPEKRYEVPSWFEVTYKYPGDVTVLCGMSHRDGITFEGQDGIIYVNRGKLESTVKGALDEPLGSNEVHLQVSKNHYLNWLDCIKSRQLPISDVAIGHRSASVCHLGNLAVRSGRKIKWDPVKEQIEGEPVLLKEMSYEYRTPWKLPDIPD